MYHRYAEVYDRSGQIQFSLRMIPYMERLLGELGWRGSSALDLACGTGTLAIAFAEQGIRAFGIDLSEAMLAQARLKASHAGKAVSFSRADMREFAAEEPVDLVTCCYDSLNYLLSRDDLAQTFRRVREALRPGGLFAFDLNSAYLYESTQGESFYSTGDGVDSFIYCAYDAEARLSTATIVGFIRRNGDGLYERFTETHVQRAYADEEVAEALREADLLERARYSCFTFDPPGPLTPRVMWVARRAPNCWPAAYFVGQGY